MPPYSLIAHTHMHAHTSMPAHPCIDSQSLLLAPLPGELRVVHELVRSLHTHYKQLCTSLLCTSPLCSFLLCTSLLCTCLLCSSPLCSSLLCTSPLCSSLLCISLLCTSLLCTSLLCTLLPPYQGREGAHGLRATAKAVCMGWHASLSGSNREDAPLHMHLPQCTYGQGRHPDLARMQPLPYGAHPAPPHLLRLRGAVGCP